MHQEAASASGCSPRVFVRFSAIMSFLKPKSGYRPTRLETVLAWVFTTASGLAVLWLVLRGFELL